MYKQGSSYIFFTRKKSIKLLSLMVYVVAFLLARSVSLAQVYDFSKLKTAQKVVTLFNNSEVAIPIKDINSNDFYSYQLSSTFDSIASFFVPIKRLHSLDNLSQNAYVFIGVSSLVDSVAFKKIAPRPFVVVYSGSLDSLSYLTHIKSPILLAKKSPEHESVAAQIIFGGMGAQGIIQTQNFVPYHTLAFRLGYDFPEEVGILSQNLTKIDNIAQEAIEQRTTPGCVVLVAKNGKVIFQKGYGYQTYDNLDATTAQNIFDLASITKIAATTPAIMQLYEERKIDLNANLGDYLQEVRGSNKEKLTLKNILLHQAGLVEFIPFSQNLHPSEWRKIPNKDFHLQVAKDFFVRPSFFSETMFPEMINSRLKSPNKYVYSDLSMYFMRAVAERQTACNMEDYLYNNFYHTLGLQTMYFNPLLRIEACKIVPTEIDSSFRNQTLRGYVHDPGAALAGGVSGHAGLFSSANDLAILFQMFLNQGQYGGRRYLAPETIQLFTSRQSEISRRGLGFDKYDPELTKAYPCHHFSASAYGHTGFTGTCIWIDPEQELIYVFLSNRIYQTATNKLSSLNIRGRILDVIYDAIKNK